MKKLAFAGLLVSACLATPAMALEHEVVIEHPEGTIAADYNGAVKIETRQVGTASVAGRPSTLRCRWTATLHVERTATMGETLRSRRTLSQDKVDSGSTPGWCSTRTETIDRIVDARSEKFRTAMLELVAQDRTVILAELNAEAAARES